MIPLSVGGVYTRARKFTLLSNYYYNRGIKSLKNVSTDAIIFYYLVRWNSFIFLPDLKSEQLGFLVTNAFVGKFCTTYTFLNARKMQNISMALQLTLIPTLKTHCSQFLNGKLHIESLPR